MLHRKQIKKTIQLEDIRVKIYNNNNMSYSILRDRRGRDRMVVGFTTTYAINAYYH